MKACNGLVSLLPPKAYVRREGKQLDWIDGSLSWASTSPLTSPGLRSLHTWWRRPNNGSSWKLKRTELSSQLLMNFYRTTTESILCLQQQTAQGIEDHHLPQLDSFYTAWVWERSKRIVDDRTHRPMDCLHTFYQESGARTLEYTRLLCLYNDNKYLESFIIIIITFIIIIIPQILGHHVKVSDGTGRMIRG